MISNPKLSVVMPAYNAGAYLRDAVSSILDQSFRDFEFIIVNDGSSDATASILQEYERIDSRIRVFHQENQGMIAALNRGCRLARGKYIARMDADDISYPDRLAKQLTYLEAHPAIGILGTWVRKLKNDVPVEPWCPPTLPGVLRWELFFGVSVAHPSILMRRTIGERLGFYRADALHVEDVDLWFRASAITEFSNLPEILYEYRVWHGGTSQMDQQIRRETHVRFLRDFIRYTFQIDVPLEAALGLRQTRVGPRCQDLRQIRLTASLVRTLHKHFLEKNDLSAKERREISWDAAKRVASLALQASRLDAGTSFSLFTQALKLDYRLLAPSAIMRGLDRAISDRMSQRLAVDSAPATR